MTKIILWPFLILCALAWLYADFPVVFVIVALIGVFFLFGAIVNWLLGFIWDS